MGNGDFQGDYSMMGMASVSPEENSLADSYSDYMATMEEENKTMDEIRKHYDSVMIDNSYPGKNQMTFAKFIDDMETYRKFADSKRYEAYPPDTVGTCYYSRGYFTADEVENRLADKFGSMLPSSRFTATDPETLYYDRQAVAYSIMNDKQEFANQMKEFYEEYEKQYGKPYEHDVDYSSIYDEYLSKYPTNIHDVKVFTQDDASKVLDLDRELPWSSEDEEGNFDSNDYSFD